MQSILVILEMANAAGIFNFVVLILSVCALFSFVLETLDVFRPKGKR